MIFFHKLKENVVAVVPIIVIVMILHLTIAPLSGTMLLGYLFGAVLLILGLTIFLIGADVGVLPMGERIGANLSTKQGMPMLLLYGAIIGFSITLAEPDLQVMAKQAASVNPQLTQQVLVTAVAIGAGLFVVFGLLRIVLGFSLKVLLAACYILIFILAQFTSPYFVPMGFDSGGVTTGPMTVPFIMALGIGVASVRRSNDKHGGSPDSFGLVSLMSVGPIVAVMLLGVIFKADLSNVRLESSTTQLPDSFSDLLGSYGAQLPHTLQEIAIAMLPLAILFFVFQIFYIKLPPQRFVRILFGLVYTYVGLVIFLLGATMGFSPVGSAMGASLAASAYKWWLIPIGLLLGFSIVFAEPAVWVLTQEVEEVTAGRISKRTMMVALAVAVAIAVALGFLRTMTGFSIWYFLVPGYALALLMMPKTPNPFTGIAFDSGGVASGVMASTFILPFALGICSSIGGNVLTDAFGTVAMIALAPLIAIQAVGLAYQRKARISDLEEEVMASFEDENLDEESENETVLESATSSVEGDAEEVNTTALAAAEHSTQTMQSKSATKEVASDTDIDVDKEIGAAAPADESTGPAPDMQQTKESEE